jgi:hypothetical protein
MSYSVLTPTDFRAFLSAMAYEAAGLAQQQAQQAQQRGGAGGAGAGGRGGDDDDDVGPSRMLTGARMMPLLELLGSADATAGALGGFNDATSECDAGRYALVVQQDGSPVSAATFNVFGEGLPAQVNLVATAEGSRRQGHCRALFEILESVMEELKVDTVIVQVRSMGWVRVRSMGWVCVEALYCMRTCVRACVCAWWVCVCQCLTTRDVARSRSRTRDLTPRGRPSWATRRCTRPTWRTCMLWCRSRTWTHPCWRSSCEGCRCFEASKAQNKTNRRGARPLRPCCALRWPYDAAVASHSGA